MKAIFLCSVILALCAVEMAAVTNGDKPVPSGVPAATRPAAGGDRLNLEILKTLDGRGGYIRLEGQFLFLTSSVNRKAQQAGFWYDVGKNPGEPALLDKSLPGAWDVAVSGDHAFVCDYTKALVVWDLRKVQRRQVAKLPMPSMTENLTIRGKLAYVANHTAGLTIVDIADPVKPFIVSNLNPGIDCDGVALWKNCAVLYGHHKSRLVLVDVTDPAKPRRTGTYQHGKKAFNQGEVQVEGGFAYCTSTDGLVIVNIKDPAKPKLVKTAGPRGVRDVTVKDGYAFICAGSNGVHVFDVTDPASPAEVGRYVARGRLSASEVAVQRVSRAKLHDPAQVKGAAKTTLDPAPLAPASFYLYVANRRGPAMVMRFQPPARKRS